VITVEKEKPDISEIVIETKVEKPEETELTIESDKIEISNLSNFWFLLLWY
jgi:hypothetical protein